METKNNGITLIALIITVIVLLILAGVTIATLTGNHGILTQVDEAKVSTIKSKVEEEIGLAVQSANLRIRTKTAADNSWNATTDENIQILKGILEEDLKDGYTVTPEELNTETGIRKISVVYAGQDYRKAKKDNNAKITKTLDVSQNKIIYGDCNHDWVDGEVIEANCTVAGSKKQTCTKCGETRTVTIEALGHHFVDGTCTECGAKGVIINIKSMILDGASLITATLTNDKIATSSDVTWSSSNEKVAKVTTNGIVKCGTETGTATITCTDSDGTTATCTVTNSESKIVYTNNGTANSTITGSTTEFGFNQPIIPVGFSAIDTKDARWNLTGEQTNYNNGLVIMDEKGNQFVWVPVDGTTVPYRKWCAANRVLIDDVLGNGTSIASVDTTTTYGGFWIGRYEAGLDVNLGSNTQLTTSRNVTGSPIIVEGAIPWNNINYTNSRANAESLVNTTYVRSGLVNGTQWDTALKWIKLNTSLNVGDTGNSTAWGNCTPSSLTLDRYNQISTDGGASWSTAETTTNGSYQMLRTGASTTTKALNISDLAGNMSEWTNEMDYDRDRDRRGGSYASGIWASDRSYTDAGGWAYNIRL